MLLSTASSRSRPCSIVCSAPQHVPHPVAGTHSAPAVGRRRACLAGMTVLCLQPAASVLALEQASLSGIEVLEDRAGSGTATAQPGDLVLVHYVGRTASGQLFDSTRGGQAYRDGGIGALRPVVVEIGGSPVPGIVKGLQFGLQGMTVGGSRTFTVPPSLGFGNSTAYGPFGIVPAGSSLRYEVELLRLSRRGPDELMTGISQCGGGFVNERTAGCANITPAEYI